MDRLMRIWVTAWNYACYYTLELTTPYVRYKYRCNSPPFRSIYILTIAGTTVELNEDKGVIFPPTQFDSVSMRRQPTQCIFCLGNEDLLITDRLKCFASRGDLKKHFHRKHLRHHQEGRPISCPYPRCDQVLESTMHLQNHAELVHNTPT